MKNSNKLFHVKGEVNLNIDLICYLIIKEKERVITLIILSNTKAFSY